MRRADSSWGDRGRGKWRGVTPQTSRQDEWKKTEEKMIFFSHVCLTLGSFSPTVQKQP